MVRGGGIGTPLPDLHRNDQGIREAAAIGPAHGNARIDKAALAHSGGCRFWLLPPRTKSAAGSCAPRTAIGKGAQRIADEDHGDGYDHRTVRRPLRTRRSSAR